MTANALSAASTLAVAAIMTPLILDRLGAAAFGIWTVIGSVVLYLAVAEAGVGPAVQRYVAVAHARGDLREPAALLWTALAAYTVAGALLCGALVLLAAPIVSVFDFPAALSGDAVDLLTMVGFAVPMALAATGMANVLFGLERFVIVTASSVLGAVVLLGTAVVALNAGLGLSGLGFALLAQQGVLLILRAAALHDVVMSGRPAFASRARVREMLHFSAKLQVSAFSVLINGQSDRVVAALVAPAAVVGRLGVAGQVAEAGRLVAGALLQPIVSRLSSIAAHGDRGRLDREYRRLSRVWIVAMTGATAVGLGLLQPLVLSWLGPGYGEAVTFGAVLVVAYGFNIVTGLGSAYLRATGAVGLEARTGVLMVGLNLLFTVPLALLAGALGVVLGTLAANVLGTAWSFWRLHADRARGHSHAGALSRPARARRARGLDDAGRRLAGSGNPAALRRHGAGRPRGRRLVRLLSRGRAESAPAGRRQGERGRSVRTNCSANSSGLSRAAAVSTRVGRSGSAPRVNCSCSTT